MHKKFERKIKETIEGKNVLELLTLEKEIEKIFYGDEFSMDSDYWDFLLMTVKKKRAILMLNEFFERVRKIEGQNRVYIKEINCEKEENHINLELADENWESANEPIEIKTEQEFKAFLQNKRFENLKKIIENKIEGIVFEQTKSEAKSKRKAEKVMNDIFGQKTINELEVNSKPDHESEKMGLLKWVEDYKPRKPHFFNRVKLGYEWNKINITRYTKDNPPPREVVGYKFNIFYPGLIDKTSVPTFKLTPMQSKEFVIISFIAGPPYAKISFQIVNGQWDMANRKNFKCLFDKNVLHLYFDFVKQRHFR